MDAVPPDTPDTIPVAEPMLATAVLPLVHTPPVLAFDNVIEAPWQTGDALMIPAGNGLTVKVVVA